MKSRKLGIALLIMLAFVVTTGTFAYWASSIAGDTNQQTATVSIGTGEAVTTTLSYTALNDTSALVPTAYADTAGVEDTAVLTMPVVWTEGTNIATGTTGTLSVVVNSFLINGSTLTAAEVDAMFNVTVTFGNGETIDLDGDAVDVEITVVFNVEPADLATYNEVASGQLDILLTISVS